MAPFLINFIRAYMKNFIILLVVLLAGCAKPQEQVITLTGNTMGTTYSVKYVDFPGETAVVDPVLLKEIIDSRLVEINQLMSTYIPDSELSVINNSPANMSLTVSDETLYVINKAIELNEISSGKLDITVGPLVNLWGFGPTKLPEKVPSKDELTEVDEYIGIDKFILSGNQLTKLHKDVYIDLSTIAKGYGVDQIAEILIGYTLNNFLVEIGGEMRLSGKKPGNRDWSIAIEKPISGERLIQRFLTVGNNSVATSGDYRNYFENDGVRYSHLIDPTTRFPIQHKLVSVTVIAEKSIMADGLATALIVLGEESGLELANKENIAALFIVKKGNDFIEIESNALMALTSVQ